MTVKFELTENGKVIAITITDLWSVQEVIDIYSDLRNIFDVAPSKLNTILDLTAARGIPGNVLRGREGTPIVNHPNSDMLMFVGASPMMAAISDIAVRLTKFESRVKFYNTLEEAYAYLRESGKS